MANLNEVTSKQLISELERRGYVIGNAWLSGDVLPHVEFLNQMNPDAKVTLTDEECTDIVSSVLNEDAYYEWVNERIMDEVNEKYFKKVF
jgi:hypothetical protein